MKSIHIRLPVVVPTMDVWSPSWSCSSHVSVLFSFSWSRASGYARSILTGPPSSSSRSLMRPHLTEKALQGLPTFPAHLISILPALPGLWARVPGSPIPLPRPHLSRLPFCQAHPQKPSKELLLSSPTPSPGASCPVSLPSPRAPPRGHQAQGHSHGLASCPLLQKQLHYSERLRSDTSAMPSGCFPPSALNDLPQSSP